MNFLKKLFSIPILLIVNIYRYLISPIFPASCRYNPTCSVYFKQAVEIWGPIKGSFLGFKRISKCHPWGGFGDDPVPKK